MTGGIQNFEATAAIQTRLGPADFSSLLKPQDEAMARVSCTFD